MAGSVHKKRLDLFLYSVLVTGPSVRQNSLFLPGGGRNHRLYQVVLYNDYLPVRIVVIHRGMAEVAWVAGLSTAKLSPIFR